jgi:hypothetical protein
VIEELGNPQALDSFGNFSHGSYSLDVGYKSRTNYSMPHLSSWTAATTHDDKDGFAHLVDLGMPVVTTPTAFETQGYFMWNKAILFGEQKRYSIMSGFNFGIGGWLYKAPLGNVWHMLATRPDASTLKIEARKINNSLTPTSLVQVLTIDISGYDWGTTFFVNFDPKGSGRAAIHVHSGTGAFGSPWVNYIFEMTVADGDDPSLPTVTATLAYDGTSSVTTQVTWTGPLTLINTGNFNKTTISEPTPLYGGPYIGVAEQSWDSVIYTTDNSEPNLKANETIRVLAIAYKKDGTRITLGLRQAVETYIPYSGGHVLSITGNYIATYDGTTVIQNPITTTWPVIVSENKWWRYYKLELTRDGVAVAAFAKTIEYEGTPMTETTSGTGQQSNGVWLQDDPSVLIDLLTTNSACIFKLASGNASMFAWASADFSGVLPAATPDLLSGKKFSFDPESGSYNRRIVKWF